MTLINYVEPWTNWIEYTPEITLVGGSGNTVPEYSTVEGRYKQNGCWFYYTPSGSHKEQVIYA